MEQQSPQVPVALNTEVVVADSGAVKVLPRVLADKGHDRAKYVGSGDVAAVLGLSRYRTPLEVFMLKKGQAPVLSEADRLWLERRKRWEPVVLQMMREELDYDIVATNVRYGDGQHEFMCSEIDGEARVDDEVANIEVKSVDPRAYRAKGGWGEPGTDDIPIEYECQVQYGLGITGRSMAIVAAMIGLDRMEFYPVRRNETIIQEMRARVITFWRDNVLANTAPDPRTLEDVSALYPQHDEGITVAFDGELAEKMLRLRAVHAQLTALELECEALEFPVKRAMGSAEAVFVDGRKVATWKTQNWSRVNVEALKMKDPKAYKAFLDKGTRRVFRTLTGS